MRRALLIVCTALPRLALGQAPPVPAPSPAPAPAPAPPPPTAPAPAPVPGPTPPSPTTPPGDQPLPPEQPSTPSEPPASAVIPTPPTPPPPESQPLPPKDTRSAAQKRHAAEALCVAHDPSCDWVATFSSLEQRSIARVLAAHGYIVEPEPWGKVIAHVVVVNEDVFAEDNWLQFFNIFHYRTRPNRVREELTIQAGEVWDQKRVEESARRLHDPLYSSVVALMPIKTSVPNEIDLLVVTRDLWSLRLNTQYTVVNTGSSLALTNLGASLSENNFLGTRDVVAFGFNMDQGAIAFGPTFLDKDLLGQHINLQLSASEIITREADKIEDASGNLVVDPFDPTGLLDAGVFHSEGEAASISLSRPLWSLATEWGGGISASYTNQIARSFTGNNPQNDPYELFPDPGTGLPYEFRYRTWAVSANAVHQWGTDYKQAVTLGYTVSDQKPSLLPSFSMFDPGTVQQFIADVFPRTELISAPFVTYSIFQPRYRVLRNVQTFELAEDLQVGPSAAVTVSQGLTALGGDFTFTRPTVTGGWTFPLFTDGFISPTAGASMRFEGAAPNGWSSIDNSADVALRVASPNLPRFRIVAYSELDWEWHNTQNQFYSIGSDSGLRGYNVSEFRSPTGDGTHNARRFIGQIEARMTPIPVLHIFRAGAVAFYELGGTANTLSNLTVYNDVGAGLRVLIPQLDRSLFRLDVAFPLQSALNNPAGHPHVLAGFASYF